MVSATCFAFFLRGKILFTGALFPFSNREIVTFKDKRKSFNYSDSCISYKNLGGGGGSTDQYGLYRDVLLDRV